MSLDPDATLSELRLLVEALRANLSGRPSRIHGVTPQERTQAALDAAGDLARGFASLDASLSAGGRLPCDWARVPDAPRAGWLARVLKWLRA